MSWLTGMFGGGAKTAGAGAGGASGGAAEGAAKAAGATGATGGAAGVAGAASKASWLDNAQPYMEQMKKFSGGGGGSLQMPQPMSPPTGPAQQQAPMSYLQTSKISPDPQPSMSDELLARYLRMNQMRY